MMRQLLLRGSASSLLTSSSSSVSSSSSSLLRAAAATAATAPSAPSSSVSSSASPSSSSFFSSPSSSSSHCHHLFSRAVPHRLLTTSSSSSSFTVPTPSMLRVFPHTSKKRRRRPSVTFEDVGRFYPPHVQPVIHMAPASCPIAVHNLRGDVVAPHGSVMLSPTVFDQELRRDILHTVVEHVRASRRQGTAKTKSRAEVSGTGKKPFPQKGTGKKRAGSLRAPQNRGGGHAFTKSNKDWSMDVGRKVRRRALCIAVTAKYQEGNLVILDHACQPTHKTSHFLPQMESWQADRVLIVHGRSDFNLNFALAARSRAWINVRPYNAVDVLAILKADKMFITQTALQHLEREWVTQSRIRFPGLDGFDGVSDGDAEAASATAEGDAATL